MDNQTISIIIPSLRKKQQTVDSVALTCPVQFELIVSRKRGIAYARNWGAKQATSNLLLFVDDDVDLKSEVWKPVLGMRQGEFSMYLPEGTELPCSRIVCIFSKDFWRIGGFDNMFTIGSEDHDLYIRALNAGLTFKPFPSNILVHHRHCSRIRNIHTAIQETRQDMIFARRASHGHLRLVLKVAFINKLRKLQFRVVLLELYWLLRLGACR